MIESKKCCNNHLLDSANSANPDNIDANQLVKMYGCGTLTDSAGLESSLASSHGVDMLGTYRDSREINNSQSFANQDRKSAAQQSNNMRPPRMLSFGKRGSSHHSSRKSSDQR